MADIKTNFSLTELNTFGISVKSAYYVKITSCAEIEELTDKSIFQKTSRLILGGGSNLLFTKDYQGIIIHPMMEGLEIVDENEQEVYIRVGSGYIWDDFVQYAISKNYGGIENLSGIPGSVGASPVQNIGAYGMEVADTIEKVEGYDLDKNTWTDFSGKDCEFAYRNSIFKREYKNSFVVCYVTYRLTKNPTEFITHYSGIEQELEKREISLESMRDSIMKIRNSKLPDVKDLGNAGSFFKNPIVSIDKGEELKKSFPAAPVYPLDKQRVKLSAAWLIDQAGLKGSRLGNAATHDKQALVLVNLGGATGKEIVNLAELIKDSVQLIFGVRLEPEVHII